jgi:hypothetical protein
MLVELYSQYPIKSTFTLCQIHIPLLGELFKTFGDEYLPALNKLPSVAKSETC